MLIEGTSKERALLLGLLCGLSSPQFVGVGPLLFVRVIYTDLLPR
jgi:hypothetical protein